MSFAERLRHLPTLGLGVSTEFGATQPSGGLDPQEMRRWPGHAEFLEVGVEVARGLDATARSWAAKGHPTTLHFLDLNLDDPEDFDTEWADGFLAVRDVLKPAWICGDAGSWHFGRRAPGQLHLLPPILSADAVAPMAEGIARLRGLTGLEVLPENPPGVAFLGDLHLLDFFSRVAEAADTGLLLDVAHLAIYQRQTGRTPMDGLDGFDFDRVIEVHVAGGTERVTDGFAWVDDDHGTQLLPDTWDLFQTVLGRCRNLRAVVFECERNPLHAVRPLAERIRMAWDAR